MQEMQETQVRSLYQEDPLEEETATPTMATHLPGKSHGWRSLVGCSPWGCKELDTTERLLSLFTFLHWQAGSIRGPPVKPLSPGLYVLHVCSFVLVLFIF